MKRSKQDIVNILREQKYSITQFSLRLEGKYTIDDASWNYRDAIAHLSLIHPQVKNIPIVVDDGKLASIFLQRIFGIRFPIGVVDYETSPYTQTTFFAWGFFVIVVENECYSIPPDHAGVKTDYHICSPKLFRVLHPLIRWVLKRNYQLLMSQDVPMRERRGALREWGYRFKSENENRSYLKALNIGLDLVEPPSVLSDPIQFSVDLERDLKSGSVVFLGRDDHRGIQIRRDGDVLSVFHRMCPHQGASLDDAQQSSGQLKCSWHGRKIKPIAVLNLSDEKLSPSRQQGLSFEIEGTMLRISQCDGDKSRSLQPPCLWPPSVRPLEA